MSNHREILARVSRVFWVVAGCSSEPLGLYAMRERVDGWLRLAAEGPPTEAVIALLRDASEVLENGVFFYGSAEARDVLAECRAWRRSNHAIVTTTHTVPDVP